MCKQDGLRVLGFAYRDFNSSEFDSLLQDLDRENSEAALEQLTYNSTFLGLVALHDPPRAQIKENLAYAEHAGVSLRMVSGDNLHTCMAFACDAGIITKEQYDEAQTEESTAFAMTAEKFTQEVGDLDVEGGVARVRNQERFEELIKDVKVVARATPKDKLLMVVGLQAMERKVAIVGEGVSDLDAFEKADVSFAMGTGVSYARNEASMILATDDVKSVMRALMWGRNIYLNMQRFLTFQMTCNIACIVTVIIGYLYLTESPINAVQLIWINLIMDILGALALAAIRPNTEDSTLELRGGQLMQKYNYRAIFGNALWMVVIMMIVIFGRKPVFGLTYERQIQTTCTDDLEKERVCEEDAQKKMFHLTMVFNTFVWLQIFNLFSSKEVNPKKLNPFRNLFFENWRLVAIAVIIAVVQYGACFAEFVNAIFETEYLTDEEYQFSYSVSVGYAVTVLASAILLKYVPVRLVEKLPVLDEDKSVGSDSKMMAMYNQQANAKVLGNKPATNQVTNDKDNDYQDPESL